MKKYLAAFLVLTPVSMLAQQTPPLTATETLAINSLRDQAQKIQEEIRGLQQAASAIDEELRKNHAGYHINLQTLQVEKDIAPTAAPQPSSAIPSKETKK